MLAGMGSPMLVGFDSVKSASGTPAARAAAIAVLSAFASMTGGSRDENLTGTDRLDGTQADACVLASQRNRLAIGGRDRRPPETVGDQPLQRVHGLRFAMHQAQPRGRRRRGCQPPQ